MRCETFVVKSNNKRLHSVCVMSHHYARRRFEIQPKYCSMTCLKLEEEVLISFFTSLGHYREHRAESNTQCGICIWDLDHESKHYVSSKIEGGWLNVLNSINRKTRQSILGSDGMTKSNCSLSLWILFECPLNILWVLSEWLLNALWVVLKSSWSRPDSWSLP